MMHDMAATLSDAIATAIRAEMGRQMIRPAELARRLGRSQPYVDRRLRGALSLSDVEDIAGALGVPVTRFGFNLPSDFDRAAA